LLRKQRTGFRAIVDEQRETCAARHRFDPECTGSGEQVEHARAVNRVIVGVDQDIEHGLTQPIRSRANIARQW
jgi:hypothetical protein